MSDAVLLAVDGGATKTDLALVDADGSLLALQRGPLSSPDYLGLEGSLDVLADLLERAAGEAGVATNDGPVTDLGELLMAGVDLPSEVRDFHDAVGARGWSTRTVVDNDTFAILRAGTEQGWGVAVVCGTGINCVGIAPDGRHARFPALGTITGDWGGGYDVGAAAVSAAARSEDGRGDKTTLEQAVPAYFGLTTPMELAEAIHHDRIAHGRIGELPPVVFAESARDAVAAEIVQRLVDEVVALARVALQRLDLTHDPVEVLLGGGLIRGNGTLEAAIETGLREVGDAITVRNT
ncbi:MAG TPA: BadF/BadG/BcrA/BcrD ATPase family protein, partial [Gaiella sp.]|nr:BadF/BadG/BcrA/BcrD ATPase family protein [Gaiella sp.]